MSHTLPLKRGAEPYKAVDSCTQLIAFEIIVQSLTPTYMHLFHCTILTFIALLWTELCRIDQDTILRLELIPWTVLMMNLDLSGSSIYDDQKCWSEVVT